MKDDKNQKIIVAGLTAFCVIAASILLFFLVFKIHAISSAIKQFSQILEPFFVGGVIAYLLAPIYNLVLRNLMDAFSKKLKPRHAKPISVGIALFVSILIALMVIVGIFALVVPSFINSLIGIVDSMQTYSNNVVNWLNDILSGHPELADQVQTTYQNIANSLMEWVDSKLTPDAEAMLSSLGDLSAVLSGVVSGVKIAIRLVKDLIIGVFISVYLLVSKRHLIAQAKKIMYGMVKQKHANYIIYECRYIQDVFGGFIRGKILDSLIIGIICFAGCTIFKFPYPIVISVIVGVTNIIPFFGPFVGAIPSAVLILVVSPIKCIYFVIFILALQQFDGNVLGPKILGNTTGLSSFWVLFSILLFGGLFGFVGMIIAVPLFAVIYSMISSYINHRLTKRTMSLDTKEYELLDHVDESNGAFVHMKDPEVK